MNARGRLLLPTLAIAGTCLAPARADAQWYFASFTGANVTRPAVVTVDQPARQRSLSFGPVTSEARPFESRQYYGGRLGRFIGTHGFAIEAEFLHPKVIVHTDEVVPVVGVEGGVPIDAALPMNRFVEHYAMTHGLNFLLVDLVWRQPLGPGGAASPVGLALRAGVGPVIPGANVLIDKVATLDYQYAGLGGQVAAGLDVRVYRVLSATIEYKLTRVRPVIDLTGGGTGRMTALTHHVAFGFALGFHP